jgi:DNA helicase-2/ATP-dependent DNA helicase PcrA
VNSHFRPRPLQKPVIDYTGGKMGVAAVPGSGKTHTLSYLAARLIVEGHLEDDQEILIVTLVNSSVDNFSARVAGFVQEYGLLPDFGYRVRTLHGLAHDIVRERPDLVGLSDRFSIVDENEASDILRSTVATWLRSHSEFITEYSNPDIEPSRVFGDQWPSLVVDLAGAIIRKAKDLQITPADLRKRLETAQITDSLLNMGVEIYTDYQRALNYRSALDFDDLIRLALQAVNTDPDYLARLRYRWPYILEDEAQDSSRLQEEILRKLSGNDGNWVRVGDPNQAIYETFTTASPQYLRNFLNEPGVARFDLPNSGRSTLSIIRLANTLIDWVRFEHPVIELRDALDFPPIEPTPPGDPQPNPPDNPQGIHLVSTHFTPEEEVQAVVKSIKRWLPEHPNDTVAVLVPRNERGVKIVAELEKNNLETIELLGSSLSTRQTASKLALILRSLADPISPSKLVALYRALRPVEKSEVELHQLVQFVADKLRQCTRLEEFLWPRPGANWLEGLVDEGYPEPVMRELEWLRDLVRRWQSATLLPVDQLLLTIAQDLFTLPTDLALAHKLALLLEHASQVHTDWNLKEFTEELNTIARNERKFIGFGEEETGFDPDKHRGKVVVATIHKAKGLEWDRVYLLSVSNYDFPSAQPYDSYISEKWFVRSQLNLPAEAMAKINALVMDDIPGVYMEEGQATRESRLDYCSERLRLLYVGITRAKKELIITWNTGKSRRSDSVPALPFQAMAEAMQKKGFGP